MNVVTHGAALTELSNQFDCIDHNLLIAELNAYGFEKQAINFIYSCLTERKKEQKLTLRPVMEMLFSGVPQGYV